MRFAPGVLALFLVLAPATRAQQNHHHHHPAMGAAAAGAVDSEPSEHSGHHETLGPAGLTYDLRWLDAMVQHHTGALRMSAVVFDSESPGVGALAREIWRDQAQEIRAMGQWRRAWYPDAPVYPVVLRPAGDPNAMADLIPMAPAQMEAMQMMGARPTRQTRVHWFLEGMLAHHGGALLMAHDALRNSSNPTIRRLARTIIVNQRREIQQIRGMLRHDGLNKPEDHRYDRLFNLR